MSPRILVGWIPALVTLTFGYDKSPRVLTTLGPIKGYWDKSQHGRKFQAYEGIPYAKPPLGELRFQPPVPVHSWIGELPAMRPGSKCLQYLRLYQDPSNRVTGAEDCLYLNVYTPIDRNSSSWKRTLLPVIFYIHGGTFQFGSGYDLAKPHYLMNQDVILVSINYRLGALGFLCTEDATVPGNMGLKDQNLALRWVSTHIESFGGDPNSITLFGVSAGGASVHYHYLSLMSRGLFHRGVSISGTALNSWTQTEASREKALKLGALMGCPTSNIEGMISCLITRPAKSIVEAEPHFMGWMYNPFTPFGPVVERDSTAPFLVKSPIEIITNGEVVDLPWITTVVSEEGLRPAAEFITDDKRMKELNDNFDTIAPYLLDYNFTIPVSEHASVARKVREHYLGNDTIDTPNATPLVYMIGDRLYTADGQKAARLQAAVNQSPVRFYYFNYRGNYSLSELYTRSDQNFGVSHADDTFYVVPGPNGPVTTVEDLRMSEYMQNLWTSYVVTGVPNATIEWTPVDPYSNELTYLHIAGPDNFWMENNTNLGENHFWSSIDFNENKLPSVWNWEDYENDYDDYNY